MSEEKNTNLFNAAGEPPIPIPPVDEAWPLMKQKLDVFMPSIPWYKNIRHWKFVTTATISAALTVAVIATSIPSQKAHQKHPQPSTAIKEAESQPQPPGNQANPTGSQTEKSKSQSEKSNNQAIQSNNQTGQPTDQAEQTDTQTTPTIAKTTRANTNSTQTVTGTTQTITGTTQTVTGTTQTNAEITQTNTEATNTTNNHKQTNTRTGISGPGHTKPEEIKPGPNGPISSHSNPRPGVIGKSRPNPYPDTHPGTHRNRGIAGGISRHGQPSYKSGSHSHSSPVYPAFSLEKNGTGYSSHPLRINDSVLKSVRATGKAAITSKLSAPSSKTNIARDKKSTLKNGALMSAGLTIGKSFPIGQQHSVPYNVNAGSNTLSDYIPAPYFRYFINDRIYLEGAFQFNSPQYTRSQTIDSTSDSVLVTNQVDLRIKKLSLEKLYYTNIPLTVHYRLFGNLYLGAGLQYSRLWGGIAQQVSFLRPTSIANPSRDSGGTFNTVSLKNNAEVYGKLKKDDWRILLEAHYTWRRFNLGIRYQQGLAPYLSVLPDGSKGKDRNTSFNLHLDYDIWQKRRRK